MAHSKRNLQRHPRDDTFWVTGFKFNAQHGYFFNLAVGQILLTFKFFVNPKNMKKFECLRSFLYLEFSSNDSKTIALRQCT